MVNIEVTTIHPLPGDTIVLRYPEALDLATYKEVVRIAETAWPGSKVVVLERGLDVEVVRG